MASQAPQIAQRLEAVKHAAFVSLANRIGYPAFADLNPTQLEQLTAQELAANAKSLQPMSASQMESALAALAKKADIAHGMHGLDGFFGSVAKVFKNVAHAATKVVAKAAPIIGMGLAATGVGAPLGAAVTAAGVAAKGVQAQRDASAASKAGAAQVSGTYAQNKASIMADLGPQIADPRVQNARNVLNGQLAGAIAAQKKTGSPAVDDTLLLAIISAYRQLDMGGSQSQALTDEVVTLQSMYPNVSQGGPVQKAVAIPAIAWVFQNGPRAGAAAPATQTVATGGGSPAILTPVNQSTVGLQPVSNVAYPTLLPTPSVSTVASALDQTSTGLQPIVQGVMSNLMPQPSSYSAPSSYSTPDMSYLDSSQTSAQTTPAASTVASTYTKFLPIIAGLAALYIFRKKH